VVLVVKTGKIILRQNDVIVRLSFSREAACAYVVACQDGIAMAWSYRKAFENVELWYPCRDGETKDGSPPRDGVSLAVTVSAGKINGPLPSAACQAQRECFTG